MRRSSRRRSLKLGSFGFVGLVIVPGAMLAMLHGAVADLGGQTSPASVPGRAPGLQASGAPGPSDHPVRDIAWVILGNDTVRAEVADTPETREQGLMHRTELADGEGMLFVYSSMSTRSFWMRNTLVPLDIAFLDDRQVIVDIQQMEPRTETLHQSTAPAMFALEVPRGWFASRGIRVGAQARIVFGRR